MPGSVPRRRVLGAAAVGAAGAAGCLSALPGSGGGDDPRQVDAGIDVPPSEATLSWVPRFTAEGHGGNAVGRIDVTGGAGTVDIDGQSVGVVTTGRIDWRAQAGRVLYQHLGVASDAVYALWCYCDDEGSLREVWVEGTDGLGLREERAGDTYEFAAGAPTRPCRSPRSRSRRSRSSRGTASTGRASG